MRELNPKFIRLSPRDRLYQIDRPIIALTGGIATGKSTVTKILKEKGLAVIDADRLVKEIYQTEEAKSFIQENFPEALNHQEIHFPKLREMVFKSAEAKKSVESFIYKKLPEAFLKASERVKDQAFLIYDVPLLYEKGLDQKVDLSIVVYAPKKIQIPRIMDRDGHAEDLAKNILDQQMDIEEKKLKANFVIHNEFSMTELTAEVDQLLLQILI